MKKFIINTDCSDKTPYQKPASKVIILQHEYHLLCGSTDGFGMRKRLVEDEEVDVAM
jgi:hypothetical protein